jgi:hypothetical protein
MKATYLDIRKKGMTMGAIGLVLFLSACEKDWLGQDAGEKVTVDFLIGGGDYDSVDEDIRTLRGGGSETVDVSLDDGFYLQATLKPELAGELRAEVSLSEGQRVYMSAYASGGSTAVATAMYTYTGGKLVADANSPLGVEPGTYDFVAYSYYGSTADPATAGIDPLQSDLVWGKALAQPITATSRTATIKMLHKFSQVRVELKAGAVATAITELTGVQIGDCKEVDLSVWNGELAEGLTVTHDATGFSSSGLTRTSAYRRFYPSPTKVTIGKIVMTMIGGGSKTFEGHSANFTKVLTAGKIYTLVLDLKRNMWSRSNIVWDGSKLTFATTPAENATIPANVQGVFFKFGSLVAVSPVGSFAAEKVLFDATGNYNYANYAAVPYMDESLQNSVNSWGDAFTTYNGGTRFNATTGKGDICSYITSQGWVDGSWRTPSYQNGFDLRTIASVHLYSFPSGGNVYGDYNYGFAQPGFGQFWGIGATSSDNPLNPVSVCLPHSGYYEGSPVVVENGPLRLWTSTVYDSNVTHSNTIADQYHPRERGHAIRCIRTN